MTRSPDLPMTRFSKTWIKFCGTTSLADAMASIETGANALGFIFAVSKRQVSPEKAQEIIRELPAEVERIGVFLNATAEEVGRTIREVNLTGVQMHGSESCREVFDQIPAGRRESLRKIQTVLMSDGAAVDFDARMADSGADAWLLDSGAGSGRTFDWRAARRQLGERRGPFIIAGGLNADNVGEAIHIFSPWGVDVVSGIEREPGRKDPEKMKAFVAAVRKAEQQ
jgi:phosphoribosylanthranilate isomerase